MVGQGSRDKGWYSGRWNTLPSMDQLYMELTDSVGPVVELLVKWTLPREG